MNIIMLSKSEFLLENDEATTLAKGKLDHVLQVAFEHGIDDDELDLALTEMVKHKHNMAHFGINGRFIFSKELSPEGDAA